MAVHNEVLSAALAICRDRDDWTFGPAEVVRALPHLPPGTIRTHVTSRLCVNAPANHPHRWPYFRRVGRGLYEVLPPYRGDVAPPRPEPRPRKHLVASDVTRALRDTAHVVVSRDIGWYVAECLEVPIVVQGRTLDEVVAGVRMALDRKLSAEDAARFGLARQPRVIVVHEIRLARSAARS